MDYQAILPELVVGSCPESVEDIDQLRREGVTAVLSMQTDEDLRRLSIPIDELQAACRKAGIQFRRAPMRDGDAADLADRLGAGVSALEELLAAGHKVYVHCTAGQGRAPSIAIGWLVRHRRWPLTEAVDHVRRCRSCSPNVDAIRAGLHGF